MKFSKKNMAIFGLSAAAGAAFVAFPPAFLASLAASPLLAGLGNAALPFVTGLGATGVAAATASVGYAGPGLLSSGFNGMKNLFSSLFNGMKNLFSGSASKQPNPSELGKPGNDPDFGNGGPALDQSVKVMGAGLGGPKAGMSSRSDLDITSASASASAPAPAPAPASAPGSEQTENKSLNYLNLQEQGDSPSSMQPQ